MSKRISNIKIRNGAASNIINMRTKQLNLSREDSLKFSKIDNLDNREERFKRRLSAVDSCSFVNQFNRRLFGLILITSLILLLTILQAHYTSALGVTPARTTVDFSPGLEKEVSFSVINSERKDMSIVIFVKGDLNQSITLKQTYAEFSSGEESKDFSYVVKLPERIEKPGLHEAEIVVMEMPKNLQAGAAFVGATVAVVTQLHVFVPYPGKYLESDVSVVDAEGTARFIIPVINRGKLDIVNARASLDIYSAVNEKVATIETDSKAVKSNERQELYAAYKLNPGKYLVKLTLTYDGETSTFEKVFNVGEKKLRIEKIEVSDFSLGEIAKFNILVNNEWSEEFNDVYVQLLVYNSQSEVMADVKSASTNVPGLSKKQLVSYWDTAGVKVGTYPGKLIVKYSDKQDDSKVDIKVTTNSIEISGATGFAVLPTGGGMSTQTILIIVVIALIVINGVWFYIYFRRKKKT